MTLLTTSCNLEYYLICCGESCCEEAQRQDGSRVLMNMQAWAGVSAGERWRQG